jgi:hypothetical protein
MRMGLWEAHSSFGLPVNQRLEDYTGALYGLCNAYCEAMNCTGDAPEASRSRLRYSVFFVIRDRSVTPGVVVYFHKDSGTNSLHWGREVTKQVVLQGNFGRA